MGEWVYTRLCCATDDTEASQAVIFTGIGGSGKTECTNRIVAYLFRRESEAEALSGHGLYKKILQANRVLHAFGHAHTETSPNSSRYGSFTRIFYAQGVDGHGGKTSIVGAQMETFLFEQHRLVAPRKLAEYNFNVFYELLGARDTPATAHLDDFGMLAPSECDLLRPPYGDYSVIDEIDGTGYFELLKALIDIGFAEEECTGIFQVLLGILHLGNVAFNEVDDIALHRKVAVIADPRPLVMAAEALGMNAMLDNLHELFTNTTKEIRGATYLSRMTRAEAENTKDQAIKAIYDNLFNSLVSQINFALAPESAPGELDKFPFIGLLDFPGFVNDETRAAA
jgi:myosin heavy subunit